MEFCLSCLCGHLHRQFHPGFFENEFYFRSNLNLEIEKIDIIDFINSEKIDRIDLLKLNVEGEEYNILYRLIESNNIHKINKFQIQYHSFVTGYVNKRNYINEFLKNNNYKQIYSYEFIWEEWEKI